MVRWEITLPNALEDYSTQLFGERLQYIMVWQEIIVHNCLAGDYSTQLFGGRLQYTIVWWEIIVHKGSARHYSIQWFGILLQYTIVHQMTVHKLSFKNISYIECGKMIDA